MAAVIFIGALFIKKGYSIERSITIDRPAQEVYDYLRHIRNQEKFSVWVMKDPNKKMEYTGTDGEVGFVNKWDGNKEAGAGEQEIKSLIQDALVDIEIRFIRPFKAVGQTPFMMHAVSENETKVTWGMTSKMPYPMNFVLVFMNMTPLLAKT